MFHETVWKEWADGMQLLFQVCTGPKNYGDVPWLWWAADLIRIRFSIVTKGVEEMDVLISVGVFSLIPALCRYNTMLSLGSN